MTHSEFKNSRWLTHQEMNQRFLEKINKDTFDALIVALELLASHPYSKLSQDFLARYRKEVKSEAEMMEIKPLMYDESGRPYMTAVGKNLPLD